MPPKGKVNQKQVKKVVEDKTFGMKNKNKSKKVQAYVSSVTAQASKAGNKQQKAIEAERARAKMEKEQAQAHKDLVGELNKPVAKQKALGAGVDPKSVLCEYFKRGLCNKGSKCRFSHDMAQERKAEKINIYADVRRADDQNMENWDEGKLNEVIETKHGEYNKARSSNIVCRYFVQAVEERKYGWFWVCPNGGDKCQYRHCLPPGFVLKSQKKEMDEFADDLPTVDEIIEEERKKIKTSTPVTLERFLKWQEDKKLRKAAAQAEVESKKRADYQAGRAAGLSGRNLFEFNPEMFQDDENAAEQDEVREAYVEPEAPEEDPEAEDDEPEVEHVEGSGGAGAGVQVKAELFQDEDLPDDDDDEDGDGNEDDEDDEEEDDDDGA